MAGRRDPDDGVVTETPQAKVESRMAVVRDLMVEGVRCLPANESLDRAAQLMRELGVGALPVKSSDGDLTGILTDRDIVVKCVAAGKDPSRVTAADLVDGAPRTVEVTEDVLDAVRLMREARIRRLPVVEGGQPVGMISEVDLVRHLDGDDLVAFVRGVYIDE